MIGQERAERSLDFGVDIQSPGFNIFAVGLPGTGRTSMILERLRAVARRLPTPPDWCYVYNFEEPHRPQALQLPPGAAPEFRRQMAELVETLKIEMVRAFETDQYDTQRNRIAQRIQDDRHVALQAIERQAQKAGLAITQTPVGLSVVPVQDGEPLSPEVLTQLPKDQRAAIETARDDMEDALSRTMRELRIQQRTARDQMRSLSVEVARSVVGPLVEDLHEAYQGLDEVTVYLRAIERHITENFEAFRGGPDTDQQEGSIARREDPLLPYQVNVVTTHTPDSGAPLIQEGHPTYPNLFGRIEQRQVFGVVTTDFTMIKPGALHAANGGFMVLGAEDLLRSRASYDGLKRSLRDGVIRIETVADELGLPSPARLDPEPITLDAKVALVGAPGIYYSLHDADPDFGDLFKVRAEFDTEIDLNENNMEHYARFIAARCHEESLPHLDRTAVARVVEEGVRLAQDRRHLSTRFGDISDIIREAAHWARKSGTDSVNEAHVLSSIEERIRRTNLMEKKFRDRIAEGTVMVDVEGKAVGRVNGLSVIGLGGYEFGQANRISVRTYPGRDGVISIDREAKLTGPIHDKGAMILSGFVSGTFGIDGPLSLSATLVFEQSYGGIDGDSASSAELYVLLSSLSGLPLRQDLAVTGSVNQHGEVQAVGGVTQKVEGFFDLCRERGLTGTQGVLLPAANAKHLTLRWDVAKAVAAREFHVYTTETIAGGIELLTGVPAGEANTLMHYPPDTVFGTVQARLALFGRRLHEGPSR
jgi:predicted ATP-dependent protease